MDLCAGSSILDSSAAMDSPVSSTPRAATPLGLSEPRSRPLRSSLIAFHADSQIHTDAVHVRAGSGILDSSAAMDPPVSSTPRAATPLGLSEPQTRPLRSSLASGDWGPSAFSTVSSTSMEVHFPQTGPDLSL